MLDLGGYEREWSATGPRARSCSPAARRCSASGLLDERFFIYSEEPDLCLRIKRAGWQVRHLPQMTIVHHAGKGGVRPRMVAQDAFARKQYAAQALRAVRRGLYLSAVGLRHLIRAAACGADRERPARLAGEARRAALLTLLGRVDPPFGTPPPTALTPTPAPAPQVPSPAVQAPLAPPEPALVDPVT